MDGFTPPDKATTMRIIIVIIAISAIGTIAHDAIVGPAPAQAVPVGNGTVKVPTHLSTLGAVLVMGTIALIVNEFDSGIGLILGLGLGFDVAGSSLFGVDGLFSHIQSGLFGTPTTSNPHGASAFTTPPTGTVPTPFGFNIPGPQGVAGPQEQWNGKAWVPVVSTRSN